jgi:hypothetical protein
MGRLVVASVSVVLVVFLGGRVVIAVRSGSAASAATSSAAVSTGGAGASARASSTAFVSPSPRPTPSVIEPVFSAGGKYVAWSDEGNYFAYNSYSGRTPYVTLADRSGRSLETLQASFAIWVGDTTYMAFSLNADRATYRAFVGELGKADRTAIKGAFYAPSPSDAPSASGTVVLHTNEEPSRFVIWREGKLSAERTGRVLAISGDGTRLAVASGKQIAVVSWDGASVLATTTSDVTPVFGGFSPDGRWLDFATSRDLVLFDTAEYKSYLVDGCLAGEASWVDSGHLVVAAGNTDCASTDGSGSGIVVTSLPSPNAAASFDGHVAYTIFEEESVAFDVVIEAPDGTSQRVALEGYAAGTRLTWSPDADLLMVEYVGGTSSKPIGYIALIRL